METMTNIIYPAIAVFALGCFALLPRAQAVTPAPDGGYPGGNTAEGQTALLSLTTGGFNTGVGFLALRNNATNSFNTAIGAGALLVNTGDENTATGAAALLSNATGTINTANGAFALFSNTTGGANTASGFNALRSNTTGGQNTAVGSSALQSNTTAGFNTAIGDSALLNNTTGAQNTASGANALHFNTTGTKNTAIGDSALANNVSDENTAVGQGAMGNNFSGALNTVVGSAAGLNLVKGVANTYIGRLVGSTAPDEASVIRIADPSSGFGMFACFIGGIYGVTTGGPAIPVVIDGNGQLGTVSSSQRFKTDIESMDRASQSILALKPVSFQYKSDKTNTPQFGLIAEEVAKVSPDLVVRDRSGGIYTVRYDAVNAMLLNEFLKEHRKVEQMQKQIDALTAGLQKVSAQIQANKSIERTVMN